MPINSRDELQQFALRQNGHPLVDINITTEQLEDAMELAFQLTQTIEAPECYNDPAVKLAMAALVKKQWAANMMKFKGVLSFTGGVELNASGLHEAAMRELAFIHSDGDLPSRF